MWITGCLAVYFLGKECYNRRVMAKKEIYIDLNALYPEASDSAIDSGKRKYYNDRVKNVDYEAGERGTKITALVAGNYDYNVTIDFDDEGELDDYSCTCAAFSHSRGPCKHIIAAALAFQEKYPQAEKREEQSRPSDIAVSQLIDGFSRTRRIRFLGATGKAELAPELVIKDGEVYVRLNIGLKKKYLVRDIKKFYNDFETAQTRRYGAALELMSVPESFDAAGATLLKFFLSIYAQRGDSCVADRDTFKLLKEETDKLMEIYSLKLLKLTAPNTGSGDRLVEKPDEFTLPVTLVKEKSGYTLNCRADFDIIRGATDDYFVTATDIYPCRSGEYDNLIKLMSYFESKKTLYISRTDMPAFYNGVIKYVKGLDISTDIDLLEFDAPAFTAKITLDYVYSEIRAEVETYYGSTEINMYDDNTPSGVVRDVEAERGLKEVLNRYFDTDFTISDEKKIFVFLKEGLQQIYNYADIYMSDSLRRLKFRRGVKMRVGLKLNGGLLDVNISDEDFTEEELQKIFKAAAEGHDFVKLSDTFIDLSDPSVFALKDIMSLGGQNNTNYTLPAYYAPYLKRLMDTDELIEGRARLEEILQSIRGNGLTQAPTAKLDEIMRPYQKEGYCWLLSLYNLGCGGILADDMGLGKSIQTIALISGIAEGKTLIICPTTLILNWISEFKKFAPHINVFAVMGSNSERIDQIGAFSKGVLITSYELIRRDYEMYENIEFELAVIDEAQYIKNPETKNAASVKSIKAKHRFALTGTPIENSLSELWSIFDFIMPGYLGDYLNFRDESEQKIIAGDEKAALKLEAMISPFVLRRLKADVLKELPPKIETEIICPLEGEQRELYRRTLALAKFDFNTGELKRTDALATLSRLRQICCDPSLVDHSYTGNSSKLDAAIQLIKDGVAAGRKILIFSQFTSMIDILRMRLAELGIAGYLLKGDTPKADRITLVNRFNSDSTPLFFISLRAGGTGLNLTGADMVIHYDPWWNTSVMEQATDRAYRIGQDKPVNVYRLLMEDSVERKIRLLQLKKQKLGQNFIKENENLDNDKILEILFGDTENT